MKNMFFLISIIVACSVSRKNVQSAKKLQIIRIESTIDLVVFTTKNESGTEKIILAEKDSINNCSPFKKFILEDSVHQTSGVKSGSKQDMVGFNLSTIDGIKIRDAGELVKIIWNCNCFTDN